MPEPVFLSVLIVDENKATRSVLNDLLDKNKRVNGITPDVDNTEDALMVFEQRGVNSVMIDIYSVGVSEGISFIDYMDKQNVPVCLYSNKRDLEQMPGVPDDWKGKFNYYYKIEKDQSPKALGKAVDGVLLTIQKWIRTEQEKPRRRVLPLQNPSVNFQKRAPGDELFIVALVDGKEFEEAMVHFTPERYNLLIDLRQVVTIEGKPYHNFLRKSRMFPFLKALVRNANRPVNEKQIPALILAELDEEKRKQEKDHLPARELWRRINQPKETSDRLAQIFEFDRGVFQLKPNKHVCWMIRAKT